MPILHSPVKSVGRSEPREYGPDEKDWSGALSGARADWRRNVEHDDLRRLRTLADWMDRKYVDPILGLVFPGLGDGLGAAFGFYTVFVAWRMGVHPVTLARMLANLGIDALLGAIPILGGIADFFYRAHLRNLELVERRLEQNAQRDQTAPERRPSTLPARLSDYVILAVAVAFFLSALLLPLLVAGWLIYWLFGQADPGFW